MSSNHSYTAKKTTKNKDSYQVNNHKNQCWIEEIKTPRDIKAHMMDRHISKVVDVRGGGGHTRSFLDVFPVWRSQHDEIYGVKLLGERPMKREWIYRILPESSYMKYISINRKYRKNGRRRPNRRSFFFFCALCGRPVARVSVGLVGDKHMGTQPRNLVVWQQRVQRDNKQLSL